MTTFPEHPAGSIKSLTGVKVGDEFIVHSRGFTSISRIVKCDKLTSKIAHIGSYRYKIENAQGYGGSAYDRPPYLHNATPQAIEEINKEITRRNQLSYVIDLNWRNVDADIIAEVYKLVKGVGNEQTT